MGVTSKTTNDYRFSSSVSGTVTDSSGNPIDSTDITVTDTSDGSTVYETQTDANGDWSTELGDGDYEVTAKKTGYETNTKTFSVSGSSVSISQTLATDKYSVSGYVLDGEQNPVDGATITVSNGSGTVTTATAGSTGYYSTNLKNGSYSLEASASGYKNGSISVQVDGAQLDSQNITLGQDQISGVVKTTDGAPAANTTVKILAVNFTALDVPDHEELNETADEYLREAENVTPPDWNPDANLRENFSNAEAKYVAAHSKSDWDVRGFDVKELGFVPTIGGNLVTLSSPRNQFKKDEPVVVSVWDPTKDPFLQDSADEDLHGVTSSGTVVFQQIGPGGENMSDPLKVETTEMVQTQAPYGKTHEAAVADLPPGFYRVYPESNPGASYPITVGDPEDRIAGWKKDLKTKAGTYTEQAKQIRNRIGSHKFEPITTTTNAEGEWSVTASTHLEKGAVMAYKVPDELDKDPRDASVKDIRVLFDKGTYNGSYVLPADTERVSVPEANVTVRVREAGVPGYGDLNEYANFSDWFDDFLKNHTYSEAVSALKQRIENASSEDVKKLYRNWLNLAKQNDEYRERVNENLNDNDNSGSEAVRTIIRESETVREVVNNTSVNQMREEVQTLEQTLAELRSNIGNGTVETDIGDETVSLRFPFSTDLSAEQVAVLVHRSDGTTQTLNPQNSSYVSIDSSITGDDAVVISDYPLNASDAPVANFDVTVANSEGIGQASESVRNPAFDGEVPSLAAIDLSTLRPGPSETVTMQLQPDADAKFKKLDALAVFGPNGNELNTSVTGARSGEFSTSGKGTYHVRATYRNLDGDPFTTTFQITAGENGQAMPAGVRVVESTTGVYLLTGDGLDGGSVALENGGSEATLFARLGNESDAPGKLHVYTHAVTLPPDSTLSLHVVRGEDRRAISETVSVTLHMASLPDGSHVYRNGKPLPVGDETRYGTIEDDGGQTVASTYTADDGTLTVQTNANPGYIDRAVWFLKTTVPDFGLLFAFVPSDLPTAPAPVPEWPTAPTASVGQIGVTVAERRTVA